MSILIKDEKDEKSETVSRNSQILVPVPTRIVSFASDPKTVTNLINVESEQFLSYDATKKSPTIELHYELPYSLEDILKVFRQMVFDDVNDLPLYFRNQTTMAKRKLTKAIADKDNNQRETWTYDVTLLPLLSSKEIDKYQNENNESNSTQKVTKQNKIMQCKGKQKN
ncbi:hypothetical protein RFI_23435 [Reticulomyxa filosa]|uniref:Uncharacterized protein n=1 Tax=Reticulomyxa filosa TaxID=46433 RepID=X6MIW5_RETFI|nr:hypothetical protein RFI_23435 [Reticulomyxa filosa]|eukprot:ETO13933.1 hypothetical protein RFI_23435 [Reticulomyxa filosa]